MYKLIPATWRASAITAICLAAIYASIISEWLGLESTPYRTAAGVASVLIAFIGIIFGISSYYSPWRWLWRKVPYFEKLLFPDINGVWAGTTNSNWPIISNRVMTAGEDTEEHQNIRLQENGIAVVIEADLFRIQVKSVTANLGGIGHTILASVDRYPTKSDIRLSYIYKQSNSDHQETDETCHIGTGIIYLRNNDYTKCDGIYWTRRNWRSGMNTAGTIYLRKISDKFDPNTHDLGNIAKTGVINKPSEN